METFILSWGFLPLIMGMRFIFRPGLKARRNTGLGLFLVGFVMLLSWFYPVWIFDCFVVARVVAGLIFPAYFDPGQTPAVIPTVWI